MNEIEQRVNDPILKIERNKIEMKPTKQDYFKTLACTLPGELEFYGTEAAELFTKEIKESLKGVLEKSFIYSPENPEEKFVTTSVDGRVCSDQLWSRDAGVLMRELVHWGYLGHACYLADILLTLINKNEDGYYTYPMYFLKGQSAAGDELDGTGTVIIGLVMLWKRLEATHSLKKRIYNFITDESSSIRFILSKLEKEPLIAGSGEFGGGMFVEGEYYNVVQNNLLVLTLKSVESMLRETGEDTYADVCLKNAKKLLCNIEQYLIDEAGAWIWCIDPKTMKPNTEVLNSKANKGFGGINGVIAMFADVFGFELEDKDWRGTNAAKKSFEKIFNEKLRKEQYEKYGMWTQFDMLISGLLTSPSYGQGYALQASLLFDRLEVTDKLISYLAEATFQPPKGYKLDRDSGYHFYERYLSHDFKDIEEFDQGCGALNLVNVAEPLKVSRMIAGIDDTAVGKVKIIPRIPPSWKGYKAAHWPILACGKIVVADIQFEKQDDFMIFKLQLRPGDIIPYLEVRLPNKSGEFSRHIYENISNIEMKLM